MEHVKFYIVLDQICCCKMFPALLATPNKFEVATAAIINPQENVIYSHNNVTLLVRIYNMCK